MSTVKIQYAKTHLSSLIAQVEAGAQIVIARGDTEVAKLVPIAPAHRDLGFGTYHLPESFFDELPDGELDAWSGRA